MCTCFFLNFPYFHFLLYLLFSKCVNLKLYIQDLPRAEGWEQWEVHTLFLRVQYMKKMGNYNKFTTKISKIKMPFLYKDLWPSAEHIHSLDGKGKLFLRGRNGDCTLYPKSPSKPGAWERSLFLSFFYIFITKYFLPTYGSHWARSWGPAHKMKVLREKQICIKD